jgi:hypothetical protein
MKLHKILLRHAGPKDSIEVVFKYVLANSEQEILDEIDNPRGGYTYGAWQEDEELYDVYDVYNEVVGTETYLQRMLRLRGEFNDEDASYDDAFYGVKHWGGTRALKSLPKKQMCLLLTVLQKIGEVLEVPNEESGHREIPVLSKARRVPRDKR